jgi:hypothetical protein
MPVTSSKRRTYASITSTSLYHKPKKSSARHRSQAGQCGQLFHADRIKTPIPWADRDLTTLNQENVQHTWYLRNASDVESRHDQGVKSKAFLEFLHLTWF